MNTNRLISLVIFMAMSYVASAQSSYLGRVATDSILNSFFEEWQITRGYYIQSEKIYKSCTFEGFAWGADAKVETNSNGKIHTIALYYDYFSSAEHMISYANQWIENERGQVTKKVITDRSFEFEVHISNSPYNMRTYWINGAWDTNSYGDFFFRSFRVFYSWLALGE